MNVTKVRRNTAERMTIIGYLTEFYAEHGKLPSYEEAEAQLPAERRQRKNTPNMVLFNSMAELAIATGQKLRDRDATIAKLSAGIADATDKMQKVVDEPHQPEIADFSFSERYAEFKPAYDAAFSGGLPLWVRTLASVGASLLRTPEGQDLLESLRSVFTPREATHVLAPAAPLHQQATATASATELRDANGSNRKLTDDELREWAEGAGVAIKTPDPRYKRPKVVVSSLLPAQIAAAKMQIDDTKYDVRFVKQDSGPTAAVNAVADADIVVIMTKFISHQEEARFKKHMPKTAQLVRVNGAVESLVRVLGAK